jgi:hypothetical protein
LPFANQMLFHSAPTSARHEIGTWLDRARVGLRLLVVPREEVGQVERFPV